ncbi:MULTISPECIES: hypothetical protein [Mesorhizobium]|uniref:Uncharacterized protein n=1 Tax=Mesorhizobium ciceri TaxID=39645 RepID=A0AB38T4A6_9HYPH|nr:MULTISPECIES: hypothetical protein [Mesorhizobium]MDF3218526.1 hypothetical protein [Mesorhizobium ciceri]UTU49660.1 hypothetical protein LRP29_19420 [Mesorhizobium ciceri]
MSQAKMAVLIDICARIGDFGLSPEEEFVLREIEAAVEPEIDFIFDPGYRAIVAEIKSKLRQELDPEGALRAADKHFEPGAQAMIWFDAALEHPADDDLLRHCVAAVLELSAQSVDVVHSVAELGDAPATCVVDGASEDAYSQLVTIYLSDMFQQPDAVESGARLARLLDRSLLLANDATADPYSFILVSRTGGQSVVSVASDELDENGRYIILKPEAL